MRKYETPSYEIEYFKLKNSVLTDISENPGIDIDDVGDIDGPEVIY